MLGKEQRYNPKRIIERRSTQKYFVDKIRSSLNKNTRLLDFGCGPGTFLAAAAPLCAEVTGVDISRNFIEACRKTIHDLNVPNARAVHIEPGRLPFDDGEFDAVLMVDVIHHLEHITETLTEVFRAVKPGGQVIIFEPNKLNPLITLVHLFDRNEWGLLRVGTPGVYRRILKPFMDIKAIDFNGIVIGPESKVYTWISEILNAPGVYPLLGWLNPKMMVSGTKNSRP